MADFNQLSRFARLFGRLSPGLDVKPLLAELKDRVLEELDYTLEADAQRDVRRRLRRRRAHLVGRVVASAPKVIVTEWIDGTPLSRIIADGTPGRARPGRLPARRCCTTRPRSAPVCCTPTRTRATSGCCPTAGSASSTSARSPACPTVRRRRSAG